MSTKLIEKNSLPTMAHELPFSDKQKFHSTPKQRRPVSTEVLSNWPFIMWLQRTASSVWWFTFLSRELSTSCYEIMHLPILGDFPLICGHILLSSLSVLSLSHRLLSRAVLYAVCPSQVYFHIIRVSSRVTKFEKFDDKMLVFLWYVLFEWKSPFPWRKQ